MRNAERGTRNDGPEQSGPRRIVRGPSAAEDRAAQVAGAAHSDFPLPTSDFAASYVSRGGDKLAAALDHFGVSPAGLICADLGCNVGGFTDCLLQRGAAKVYAVDTGYGELAWKLRKDERVVVMERANALHVTLPEPVSLVTIDVAWTRQHLIVPAAVKRLAPGGCIVTLIKPHYEADKKLLRGGVLPEEHVDATVKEVSSRLASAAITITQLFDSPIRGRGGNRELFGLIRLAE